MGEGALEIGHRRWIVALIDGLPSDREGEALGLSVKGAMHGAELAQDQGVEELEGVDPSQASAPTGVFGQLEDELGIETLVKLFEECLRHRPGNIADRTAGSVMQVIATKALVPGDLTSQHAQGATKTKGGPAEGSRAIPRRYKSTRGR